MKARVMMAWLLVFGCTNAFAQAVLPSFGFPIRPQAGVFYDATQSGTGVTVDVIPLSVTSDLFFGTYYHYAPDGSATWMNFQNTVVQAPMAEYQQSGVAAYVRSNWLRAQGGQCFDCAYHSITSDFPPLGERTIEIVGGRHLRMPASGSAAVRNMKLVNAVTQGLNFSGALLESGAVWSVKQRSVNTQGVVTVNTAGWLKFRKRPGTDATAIFSTLVDPNAIIPLPAHVQIPVSVANASQQYEGVCVRSGGSIGSCFQSIYDGATGDPATNAGTFLIDPSTDRIRFLERCTSGAGAPCPVHLPTFVQAVGDVIEAGPDAQGMDRLVIRVLAPWAGGYTREFELTRIGTAHLAEVFPNGVP